MKSNLSNKEQSIGAGGVALDISFGAALGVALGPALDSWQNPRKKIIMTNESRA